jgi:hypothetical protein
MGVDDVRAELRDESGERAIRLGVVPWMRVPYEIRDDPEPVAECGSLAGIELEVIAFRGARSTRHQ